MSVDQPTPSAAADAPATSLPEWNFATVDRDHSTDWSNHACAYMIAFTGHGWTPAEAFAYAKEAGEIPAGLGPQDLTAWPTHAESYLELDNDGDALVLSPGDDAARDSLPTSEQAAALGDLIRRFGAYGADVNCAPFDLPDRWIYVVLRLANRPDFHCGIDPQGGVSS